MFKVDVKVYFLCEVPFNSMGWSFFVYYKPWFIWTLLCLPMGYIGLIISILVMIIFGLYPLLTPSTYETQFKCSSETFMYDDTYKAYLEDSSYGNLKIGYMDA